jgi:hypothetical protein
MNPELMRNIWLEASPRRLAIMGGVLGFILFTALLSAETEPLGSVAGTAEVLFYFLVVLWGTRSAASAVVDEIRDRTWDLQRLSAIKPWDMVWGKLLGATSYVWFGGLMCLVPILLHAVQTKGPGAALLQLVYYLSIGLIGHSAALLISLVAIRRRMNQTRLNVFGFQIVGILAAAQAWSLWSTATPGALGLAPWISTPLTSVDWYGRAFDAPAFYLVSLALFLAWILAGAHQFMRHELSVRINPWAWTGFLIFIAFYTAGFAAPAVPFASGLQEFQPGPQAWAGPLAATAALLTATYVSLVAMPKERVAIRWLLSQAAQGRAASAVAALPGWAMGFVFTAVAATLAVSEVQANATPQQAEMFRLVIVAFMGELARNAGVFLFFNMLPGQRRGDFAALLTLVLLYSVAPLFLQGMGLSAFDGLLSPWHELAQQTPDAAALISPWAMWIQAALIWPFAMLRLTQAKG